MAGRTVRTLVGVATLALATLLSGQPTGAAGAAEATCGVTAISPSPPLDRSEEPGTAPCAGEAAPVVERHAARIEQDGATDQATTRAPPAQ